MKTISSNRILSLVLLFIPYYGKGYRFRALLRARECCRIKQYVFWGNIIKGYLQHHYGCELSVNATISPKVQFMHTVGVVIGEGSLVEDGVIIYSGVVLGRKDIGCDKYPTIRKNACLCTKCSILGDIEIGENCIIGAHSLVLKNCDPNSTYIGVPAKKL